MLNIVEDIPFEMLRQKAIYLNAELKEGFGISQIHLDNSYGEGYISLIEIFPGLSTWIYNIRLTKDLIIKTEYSSRRTYHFGYITSGHQFHRFGNEDNFQKNTQNQNIILACDTGVENYFKIPADVHFKSCYLILNPFLIDTDSIKWKRSLALLLKDALAYFENETSYRYTGILNAKTGIHVNAIINNSKTDLVARIQNEAAVFNMLASQIEEHDQGKIPEKFQLNLTQEELSKIADIGDFIHSRIYEKLSISDISHHLGVSSSKLQRGLQFLYGCSVNEFISNHRLERAREFIHTTDLTISEVCYRVGYNSRSYFSKIFEEKYGMLPNIYKQKFASSTMLYEISYRSIANRDTTSEEISHMIEKARERNHYHNITGNLIFHHRVFFQIIEGPQNEVLQLFENIKKDKRHSTIYTMWEGFKPKRHFENWDLSVISEEGALQTNINGNIKELDLSSYLNELDHSSILTENLWRKVRNILKQLNP